MKRIFALVLLACMMFSLCACGASQAEYKLGLGVAVSTDSSAANNAQVDSTFAAVVLDKDSKIVACRLDCAQNKMDVTDGAVDTEASFLTKMELGDDYNMVKFSDATIEWYDQAKNFEAYVVGKTAAEVEAIETTVNEEGHNVAVDEELFAGCSISIEDFITAVVKACNDEKGATFTAGSDFTLGVAAISTADESVAATEEEDGVVKMYSHFGAAVVDQEGKILAALTDATQPQIAINVAGEIGDITFNGTKRELGPDYNMVKFGAAIAEWDEQAKAFADFTVGKTADEVLAIETTVNEEGNAVAVDETLFASCTMSIADMMVAIAQAVNYAR